MTGLKTVRLNEANNIFPTLQNLPDRQGAACKITNFWPAKIAVMHQTADIKTIGSESQAAFKPLATLIRFVHKKHSNRSRFRSGLSHSGLRPPSRRDEGLQFKAPGCAVRAILIVGFGVGGVAGALVAVALQTGERREVVFLVHPVFPGRSLPPIHRPVKGGMRPLAGPSCSSLPTSIPEPAFRRRLSAFQVHQFL